MTREQLFDIAETILPLTNTAPGRSSLLRAGLIAPSRTRRFGWRRSSLLVILAVVAFYVAVVTQRLLPANGPGWALYALHDEAWLRLYGYLWLAPFPFGLAWLLPTTVVLLLGMIEFLGLGQPMRHLQVAVLQRALRRLPVSAILTLSRLGWGRGLILAVASDMDHAAYREAIARLEAGQPPQLERLFHAKTLVLHLTRARGPDIVLGGIEIMALAKWVNVAVPDSLRRAVGQTGDGVDDLADAALTPMPPEETRRLAHLLLTLPHPPTEAIAAISLAAALSLQADGREEHLQWFDNWVEVRRHAAAEALALAEGWIAFEVWAALAERSVKRSQPGGLMSEVLGQSAFWPRDRGEVYARFGQEAGR